MNDNYEHFANASNSLDSAGPDDLFSAEDRELDGRINAALRDNLITPIGLSQRVFDASVQELPAARRLVFPIVRSRAGLGRFALAASVAIVGGLGFFTIMPNQSGNDPLVHGDNRSADTAHIALASYDALPCDDPFEGTSSAELIALLGSVDNGQSAVTHLFDTADLNQSDLDAEYASINAVLSDLEL